MGALYLYWKLAKYAGDDISYADALATLIDFDKVLGLTLNEKEAVLEIPEEIDTLPLNQIVIKSHVGGLVKSFERKVA